MTPEGKAELNFENSIRMKKTKATMNIDEMKETQKMF